MKTKYLTKTLHGMLRTRELGVRLIEKGASKLSEWLESQKNRLISLSGRCVERWLGVEMAVREVSDTEPPIWYSDEIPMLQFVNLGIELKDGQSNSLTTYQSDYVWGLQLIDGIEPTKLVTTDINCIFREREVEELPKGKITSAFVNTDKNGDISELIIEIDDKSISFKAGEIYDEFDTLLRVTYMDESVLVQINGKMPKKIA